MMIVFMRVSNFIQLWTVVDFSGYYYNVSIYRRNGEKESAAHTLLRMTKPLPPGSLIVGDSYFGGLSTLEGLALEGKHSLFSCCQTRPSFLFKDSLKTLVEKDHDSASVFGRVTNDVPFIANVFQSQGRRLFTLSTSFSSQMEAAVTINGFIDDETEDNQQVLVDHV